MSKDTIYREDAIKAIDDAFDSIPMEQTTEILKARRIIRTLPSADRPSAVDLSSVYSTAYKSGYEKGKADRPQEWIPCSERLPSNFSEDDTVLVTTDVDGDRVIAMFALDVKSFYLKGYVSAWMPLPKPWKGADDE